MGYKTSTPHTMTNYGFSISLKDLASAQFSKLGQAGKNTLGALTQASDKFKSKMAGVGNSIDGLRSKLDGLEKKRNLSLDTREIRRANQEIQKTEAKLRKLETLGTGGGFLKGVSSIGTPILAGAGIAAAGAGVFAKEAVQTGARFEVQDKVLGLKVGQEKAAAGFSELDKFIDRFKLPMEETREMFVALSNKGITPTMDKMEAWGNILARTPGKNPMQMAEALMDAMGGEFVRMQEFGIRGKQVEGGKIQLKDVATGFGATINNDPKAIMDFIDQVGRQNTVSGMLAAKASTAQGAITGLSNAVEKLKVKFAAGLNPATTGILTSLTELVKVLADNAQPAAEGLAKGLSFLAKNMMLGIAWMKEHKEATKAIAFGIVAVTTAVTAVTAATWLWNIALAANPVGAVVIGIAALAAVLYYAYQKSEGFRVAIDALWSVIKPVLIWQLNFALNTLSTIFESISTSGFGVLGVVSSIVEKMGVLGQILGVVVPGLGLFMKVGSAFSQSPSSGTRGGRMGKGSSWSESAMKSLGLGAGIGGIPTVPAMTAIGGGGESLTGAADKADRTGVKNFYINIEKLVEQINVYSQSAKDSVPEFANKVKEALVTMSNDVQLVANTAN